MTLSQPYKTLPESIIKMILQEFIKDGISFDDMEVVYEDTGTFDDIKTILKKFGFTDVDYEDIGFFAELFMLNEDNIDGRLIIPKLKKFKLYFRVTGRKYYTERWVLDYNAYNKNFVNDMFNNGDLSYYDGDLIDEENTDNETDDWDMTSIEYVGDVVKESKKNNNVLLENRKERQNELKELQKLKMIIEQRIELLTP